MEEEFLLPFAPQPRNHLPTDVCTFEGGPIGREDHLLSDGLGPGVVVDILEQTSEPLLQHRIGIYQEEMTASW